jgi:hypothetical protein
VRDEWKGLCGQAASEQNPQKLLELLEGKQRRLDGSTNDTQSKT